MEDIIIELLKFKKVDRVIVFGGCIKYIQVLDVSWNKFFKVVCIKKYDEWLEIVGIYEETVVGNLRVLSRRVILQWIFDVWVELLIEVIKEFFRSCVLNFFVDGLCDDVIFCFKDGQLCSIGKVMFRLQLEILSELVNVNFFDIIDFDVEEAYLLLLEFLDFD